MKATTTWNAYSSVFVCQASTETAGVGKQLYIFGSSISRVQGKGVTQTTPA